MRSVVFSCILLVSLGDLFGAPAQGNDPKWLIDSLSIRLSNYEAELRTLEERLNNQSETTDAIQKQLVSQQNVQKNANQEHFANVKQATTDVIHDLKILKNHLESLSKSFDIQNQKNWTT